MTDLDKAREWAKSNLEKEYFNNKEGADVAAKIIQSLPDQWVDVEKVREAISGQLSEYPRGTVGHCVAEEIARDLEALLAPKLPTLADMTEEERKACLWMQCTVAGHPGAHVVIQVKSWVLILLQNGSAELFYPQEITPLPDLPKLQWPGTEVVEPPALPEGMRLADHEEYGRVVTSPWGDGVDDYKIFFLNEDVRAGADYEYAHESTLTFLDGEA